MASRTKVAEAYKAVRALKSLEKVASWEFEDEDAWAAIPAIGPIAASIASEKGEGPLTFFNSSTGQALGGMLGATAGVGLGLKGLGRALDSGAAKNVPELIDLLKKPVRYTVGGALGGTALGGTLGSYLTPDRETFLERLFG
jgi:hypothetical protein